MSLSKEPKPKNIDFTDKRVKEFLSGGAPVLEDLREEERRLESERIKQEIKEELEEKLLNERVSKLAKQIEEDDKVCKLVTMRVPLRFLEEIDEAVKKGYTNRTAWIFDAIQRKLKETQ